MRKKVWEMKVTIDARNPVLPDRDKLIRMLFLFEYRQGSCRSVAGELGWGKSRVSEEYARCRAAGLSYEDARKMSDEEILRVLGKAVHFLCESRPKMNRIMSIMYNSGVRSKTNLSPFWVRPYIRTGLGLYFPLLNCSTSSFRCCLR